MLCCVTKGRDCGTLDTGGEAMNAVGKNLKQLRQREKLTQDALAERLHAVSYTHLTLPTTPYV